MAKNYVQPGNVLTAVAGVGGVRSGTVQVIGSIVGVAATGAAEGEEYELDVSGGVFEVAKTGGAWTMGAPVYYDPATKSVTATAGALKKIGVAAQSAAAPAAIGVVRFNRDFT